MEHQCSECKTSYSTLSNLRKHVTKFHPEDISQLAPLRYKKSSQSSNIKCNICEKTFNHTQSLRKHAKMHDSQQTLPNKDLKKTKKCPLCDFSDLFKNKLLEHFQNLHEIELCLHNLTFSSMDEFNQWKSKYS